MRIPLTNLYFADPYYLLLLIFPVLYWIYRKKNPVPKLKYTLSTTLGFKEDQLGWKARLKPYLNYLLYAAAVLFVIAMARPQDRSQGKKIYTEGIDIALSVDISRSMDVNDLQPTRLEAAKEVAKSFVMGRPSDRIGLVIFAGESFTLCPVTHDHQVLIQHINQLNSGMLASSTAIGMGLASAVNSLKSSTAASKVIILMTDGVNEGGVIAPETALEIAKMYGITVYTIGVGTYGDAFLPLKDEFGNVISLQRLEVTIDEELLKKIAAETNGKYFRATDNATLRRIYQEIDQLEKSKIDSASFVQYRECYKPLIRGGIYLIVAYLVLSTTLFRSLTKE